MNDADFDALNEAELAALLADVMEDSIRDGGAGLSLGPTDAALAAKALRLFASQRSAAA